jgi:hypothetical protein
VTVIDFIYIVLQLLKKKMKKLEEDFEKLDHSKIETLVADDGNLTDTVNWTPSSR